ncbi:MAG: ROK family protein [Pyrinomonadaceae bacterium]|nr:ROK family protein [Pyrinomonadaceae bacterium]
MNREIVLSADLGGTNLRVAAVDRDGSILFRTKRETPRTEDAQEILCLITDEAEKCRRAVESAGKVLGIGAVVPGTVNAAEGIVLKAPNVAALNEFGIGGEIGKRLNLPCFLENDANAAAIGESWCGASKGFQNSICVTLGTGVGGGIIIDGKILRGIDGTAGEVGHICVEPFGAPCGCGSRGCVEQYSSASAVKRLAYELGEQFPDSHLLKNANLTALQIYQAGKSGDALALEVFRQQGFYLGIALAGLINTLNPEIIVIGGGAAAGWDLFLPFIENEIKSRAYREPAKRAKIVRAELGDDAGIMGAARLAFENIAVVK